VQYRLENGGVFETLPSCHIPLRSETYLCVLKPISKLTYQMLAFSLSFATRADLSGAKERGEKRIIRRMKFAYRVSEIIGEKGIITR